MYSLLQTRMASSSQLISMTMSSLGTETAQFIVGCMLSQIRLRPPSQGRGAPDGSNALSIFWPTRQAKKPCELTCQNRYPLIRRRSQDQSSAPIFLYYLICLLRVHETMLRDRRRSAEI